MKGNNTFLFSSSCFSKKFKNSVSSINFEIFSSNLVYILFFCSSFCFLVAKKTSNFNSVILSRGFSFPEVLDKLGDSEYNLSISLYPPDFVVSSESVKIDLKNPEKPLLFICSFFFSL